MDAWDLGVRHGLLARSRQLIAADTFKHMRVYTVVSAIHLAIIVPRSLTVRCLERRFEPGRKLQNRSP